MVFCHSREGLESPDLQLLFTPGSYDPKGSHRLGFDPQIWASPRLGQKGSRGRPAKPAIAGHLRIADTLLDRAIVVPGQRVPRLLCRFNKAMGP
jgi:hypothetical protein